MDYLYTSALKFHLFFIIAFCALTLYYIWLVWRPAGERYVRNIRLFLALYHCVLAIVIFTGVVILPIFGFAVSASVWLMILLSALIIASSVVLYKSFKRTWHSREFGAFRSLATRVLLINLAMIVAVSVFHAVFI